MHHLLENLTAPQREAVQHVDGPMLVLAGPGSGKTRVVTHRLAYLLAQGIPARNLLALTFTNKAADEMQTRLNRLAPGQPVWIRTFHRFCAAILRQYAPLVGLSENFTIYDAGDSLRVLKRTIEGMDFDSSYFTPEQISSAISRAKNSLVTVDRCIEEPRGPIGQIVAQVYPAYQRGLLASNAVDFDDLLLHVATLLAEQPEVRATLDQRFRYVLVDEYQDTNLAQYAVVRGMSVDHPNLGATGDPDQSIYGWRGANLSNILEFERDFPEVRVVRLEQNFRSTKRILRAADHLIAYNRQRRVKHLFTDNDEGVPVRLVRYESHKDEAEGIAAAIVRELQAGRRRPRDIAVFYRVNALSRSLEFALRDQGVPYQLVNGLEFYQRKEIKDVVAYLQLLNNPRDDLALLRVINTPPRGIGKGSIERLDEHARRYKLTLLEAARESGLVGALPKRAAVSVARFVAMYDRLCTMVHQSVEQILRFLLVESGYKAQLQESGSPEDDERLANIEELITAAREFDERHGSEDALAAFVEQVCLVNDTDNWADDVDRVTLMTLHAAKGLEFPVVYIVALEEGLMPHERSKEDSAQLEEERRLLFVGMTRAEQELNLSLARVRDFRGSLKFTVPSKFLQELPAEEIEAHAPAGAVPLPQMPPVTQDPAVVTRRAQAAVLVTAAQLAGSEAPWTRSPPESFTRGMRVEHPEHGQGEVIELSGSGQFLCATVRFDSAVGTKKFVLVHCSLKPVTAD